METEEFLQTIGMSNMFHDVVPAPVDPIFGMFSDYVEDKRDFKVNLGIGTYRTEELKPYVLPCVIEAEKRVLNKYPTKEYLPIDGDPQFVQATQKLIFGEIPSSHYGAQAIGGTGALHVGARLIHRFISQKVFIPSPTWDNHHRIFSESGFAVGNYPVYDYHRRCFDFEGMCEAIHQMPKKSAIILQASCQNPTGCDPTNDQWDVLRALIVKKELTPFFDLAYLGFGQSPEQETYAIRTFYQNHLNFLVAASFSKNFGLYAERVGSLFAVCKDKGQAQAMGSQIKLIIRSEYSNPPCHGGRIVAELLNDSDLKVQWERELEQMRLRIDTARSEFVKKLEDALGRPFQFLLDQKGMFSYMGLRESQVQILTKEYAIYLPKNGRINVAGLTKKNLDYVVAAIKASGYASSEL